MYVKEWGGGWAGQEKRRESRVGQTSRSGHPGSGSGGREAHGARVQVRVRHALRVRHDVVRGVDGAEADGAAGRARAHAQVGKRGVDALELADELGVVVVEAQREGVVAAVGLGRVVGLGLVEAARVLELRLSPPQVRGDATAAKAERVACGGGEVDGRGHAGEDGRTRAARAQVHVFGCLTGGYALGIVVLHLPRLPFRGFVGARVLRKLGGRNEDCVTCKPMPR